MNSIHFFAKKAFMTFIRNYKNTLLILIILLTNSIFAQNDSIINSKAQPPFETNEYVSQIVSNLNLPEEKATILPNENITFNLSFFVSNEGKVNNVRVKNDSYELSSYFENAMKNLPNWTPAKIKDENKSSREQLVIQLNLKAEETNNSTNPEEAKQNFYREFAKNFILDSKSKRELRKLGYQKNGIIDLKFNVAFVLNEKGEIENLRILESNLDFLKDQVFKIIREYPWGIQQINGKPISKPFTLKISLKINS